MARAHALLSVVPCSVTLLEGEVGSGRVLLQNEYSREYFGDMRQGGSMYTGSCSHVPDTAGGGSSLVVADNDEVLQRLFSVQPELMEEALADVQMGMPWIKVGVQLHLPLNALGCS